MLFHKIISTGLGIGYIERGAGTVAAVFTCFFWYIFQSGFFNESFLSAGLFTIGITIFGIWSAGKMEPLWGKDHNRVVIDEVAGMCITLLFVPVSITYIVIGLIFFRFFDIVKPLFIRRLEALKGGWGVMADDVLAGIYANLMLQTIILFQLV